jgi:hypothetical protein
MKSLRAGKVISAAVIGFIIGAWLFYTGIVKAKPQDTGTAHVYIVPVTMLDTKTPLPQNLPGVRIAGISCVAKPMPKFPDAAICYVATTLAE